MIALSAKDIFKESFDQFRKRPLFLIGLMLMLYVPSIINLAAEAISKDRTLLTIVLAIVFYLVGIFLNVFLPVALLKVVLTVVDNKKVKFREIFDITLYFFLIATALLYVFIAIGGFALLIVPGIIWALQFSLACYCVIDKRQRPIEALKSSSKLTQGHKWMILRLALLGLAINILGFLAFGVGILISSALCYLASAILYRKLAPLNV